VADEYPLASWAVPGPGALSEPGAPVPEPVAQLGLF